MLKGGHNSDYDSETEVLFFRTYNSYLLQSPSLRDNYAMLKDAYQNHPDTFKIFSKNDILRLKQVQNDIRDNKFTLFSGPLNLESVTPERIVKEKSSKKHADLCMSLVRNIHLLESFTGPIDFINNEHPVRYGSIDLFAQSGPTAYIIEVKTETADHSIAGQVMKYFIGVSLRLILKAFDEIKIITICPNYDKPSHKLLRNLGAQTLSIRDNPLTLKEFM